MSREQTAFEASLGILAAADQSSGRLSQKLARQGYSPEDIDAAIARLQEMGLLDDLRMARAVLEGRRRAGYGDRRTDMELRRKGLPDAAIAAAHDELDQLEQAQGSLPPGSPLVANGEGALPTEAERCQEIAQRLYLKKMDRSAVGRALIRRGYGEADVWKALAQLPPP